MPAGWDQNDLQLLGTQREAVSLEMNSHGMGSSGASGDLSKGGAEVQDRVQHGLSHMGRTAPAGSPAKRRPPHPP